MNFESKRRVIYEGAAVGQNPKTWTDFSEEHFKKWINLDPYSKMPSLVYYDPDFLHAREADHYYETIKNGVKWEQKVQHRNGNAIPVPRLTCWFGPLPYGYGKGISHKPNEQWPPYLYSIKSKIEAYLRVNSNGKEIEASFNSVLLNFYRDGNDGVAWHSDDEKSMGICPTIASISLGETRKFELKKYSGTNTEWCIHLKHGSLLVMAGNTQLEWKHRVPTEYNYKRPRINLTFRKIEATK